MADIELVIKIDEDVYKKIVADKYAIYDKMFYSIKNGTPLDKHDEEVIAETVKSIWGKPPYRDMLDKIRTEITEYAMPDFEYHGCGGSQKIVELEDVLQIIDKYRGEVDCRECKAEYECYECKKYAESEVTE